MAGHGRVWIQGAGEMASGAAVALLSTGYQVVLAEIANPLAVRRLVCFSEAIYEGVAVVAGRRGQLMKPDAASFASATVAVLVDPAASQLHRLDPDVVVDARMTKVVPHPLPRGSRPLIGLGPGFTCGRDADLVVETLRGADLGQVIATGQAAGYTGNPGPVGGRTIERLLRAPAAGNLVPIFKIGDLVSEGQVIGHVGGLPVISAVSGLLRGLVHPQAELVVGEKVGDVDPRGEAIDPTDLTDKAQRVGEGVCKAVAMLCSQGYRRGPI